MRTLTITAALTFLIDQISKYYVIFYLDLVRLRSIDVAPPYVNFRYAENYGINFGLGGDAVNKWIWIGLALAVCAWLWWWVRREDLTFWGRLAAGLVLGGAFGNIFDRLYFGYVLDFLNMSCCGIRNPYSFNIADIFIFAGAFALVFLAPERKKPA